MAIPHAAPGQVIDLLTEEPTSTSANQQRTTVLAKSERLELIRLVLPAGKQIAEHRAPGDLTVQCLSGEVDFTALGRSQTLSPGKLLYLSAHEPHALSARSDATLLLTLLLVAPPTSDEVNTASAESFPASDAPAWTP